MIERIPLQVAADRMSRICQGIHGRWRVIPISETHRERCVVEVVDMKFRDTTLYFTADYAGAAPEAQIEEQLFCRPDSPLSEDGREYLVSIGLLPPTPAKRPRRSAAS